MDSVALTLEPGKRGSQSSKNFEPTPDAVLHVTAKPKLVSLYDPAVEQHLIDHGILLDNYEYPDGRLPPKLGNIDELMKALPRRRASLSPSCFTSEDFQKFRKAAINATKEDYILSEVFPFIEGNKSDSKCIARNLAFVNLEPLTDGSLVAAKPDICYGARPEQLDRVVRKELGGHVIPSPRHEMPVASNMFLEVKGPHGSAAVARRQIAYYTAIGERGQLSLRSLKTEPTFDHKTNTIGYVYSDGYLKLYATHSLASNVPGGKPGFVMTMIDAWAVTGNERACREGFAAYRNGRDWAKARRDETIKLANKRARDEVDDGGPPGKRARGHGEASSSSRSSQSGSKEVAAPGGSSSNHLATDMGTLGNGEQQEQSD